MGGGNAGQQESQAAQQAQDSANAISAKMSPIVQGMLSGINMPAMNAQVMQYLLNPQGTALAQMFPQLQQFFSGMMQNGMDPRTRNNAMNNYQVQTQQGINSLTNQLGAALPNLAGTVRDMNLQGVMGRAQLGSDLAAQDQGIKAQGAAGLQAAGGMLDDQAMRMLTGAEAIGQGASQDALSTYGNMFAQYQNAATQDTAIAAQLQQQESNFWGSLLNGIMGAGELYASSGLSGFGKGGGGGGLASISASNPFGTGEAWPGPTQIPYSNIIPPWSFPTPKY